MKHSIVQLLVGIVLATLSFIVSRLTGLEGSESALWALGVFIVVQIMMLAIKHEAVADILRAQGHGVRSAVAPIINIHKMSLESSKDFESIIKQFSDICTAAAADGYHFARCPALSEAIGEVGRLFRPTDVGYAISVHRAETVYSQLASCSNEVFIWEPDVPESSVQHLYSAAYRNVFLRRYCGKLKSRYYVYTANQKDLQILKHRTEYLKDCQFLVYRLEPSAQVVRTIYGESPALHSHLVFGHPNGAYTLVSVMPFFMPYRSVQRQRASETIEQLFDEQNFQKAAGVFMRVICYHRDNVQVDATAHAIHSAIILPLVDRAVVGRSGSDLSKVL